MVDNRICQYLNANKLKLCATYQPSTKTNIMTGLTHPTLRQLLLLCVLLAVAYPSSLFGQLVDQDLPNDEKYYYDFHPLSTLTLGGTFDPNHLDEAKISPLRIRDTVHYEGPGSIQTNFELHLVNSLQQLRSVVQFDAKTDVRYFKVKASARFGFLNSYTFNQNDINLVISARSEYSRRGFRKFDFTPEALELMDDPQRFRKVYGTRVVTMERLGSAVFVVLKISDVSSSMRNKITAGFNMEAKFGPAKVNVSTAFRKEVQKASNEKRIDLTVVSTADMSGVPGLTDFIDKLHATGYDFDLLMKAISDYMKTIEPKYAKPIGYFTTSINNLGLPKPRIEDVIFSQKLETAMAKVADLYRTALSERDLIVDLLNGVHPAHVYLSPELRNALSKQLAILRLRMDELTDIQEKFVKKYDSIDSRRRARKIDEERGFRTWKSFFALPELPRDASKFLNKHAGVSLCSEGDDLVLSSKGIESIQLVVNWIGGSDSESKRELIPVSQLFADATGRITHNTNAPGPSNTPIEKLWGARDVVRVDRTSLRNYFTATTVVSTVIQVTPHQRPSEPRYSVDLLVKNALGYEASFPLGVIYYDASAGAGSPTSFFVNEQACQVIW